MLRHAPLLLSLTLWGSSAFAGPHALMVSGIDVPGTVEVPLLRGDVGSGRPLVEIEWVDEEGAHRALALVDVAGGPSRMGRTLASQWGLPVVDAKLGKTPGRMAVVPEVRIGELVIRDLPVQIVPGDEFVVGFAAMPKVAVALLPSEGVVRVVPAASAPELLASVGTVLQAKRQSVGKYTFDDEKLRGDGVSFSVPGRVAGREGRLEIRTDRAESRVTRSYQAPSGVRRAGVVHLRARGHLGQDELPGSWVMKDESLSHPSADFVGIVGYDQLYATDIAFAPASGRMAVRPATQVQFTPAASAHLEIVTARYSAAGMELVEGNVAPPRMGFSNVAPDPSGDEGSPLERRLEGAMADALWDAGRLDEALRHQLAASQFAGDHCGPYMELGERRLAWSGVLQKQPFVVELIRQPLRSAGELWDRWAALTPEQRDRARAYEDLDAGVFAIPQEPRCLTAWGHLMAAYVAQGNTAAASEIYTEHHGYDPIVDLAQGLSLLARGRPETAEIPIRVALSVADQDVAVRLALGTAMAGQGKAEAVREIVDVLSEGEHGLTAALAAVEWANMLDADGDLAKNTAARMIDSDPFWIPGHLVGVWLKADGASAQSAGAELSRAEDRLAGRADLAVYRAVLNGLAGEPVEALEMLDALAERTAPTPDLFAARALLAELAGDAAARDLARSELKLRFPTLASGDLGLPTTQPAEVTE